MEEMDVPFGEILRRLYFFRAAYSCVRRLGIGAELNLVDQGLEASRSGEVTLWPGACTIILSLKTGNCNVTALPRSKRAVPPPRSTQGPTWRYLKVNFSETLSIFGDNRPRNGSKNGEMAPRTGTGCPHIGPFVVPDRKRSTSLQHTLSTARTVPRRECPGPHPEIFSRKA